MLVLSSTAVAAQSEVPRLLVQRVEAVGVDVRIARSVEEAVVFELGRRSSIEVLSPAELQQTIAFAKTQTELGCDALDECMVEVQRKLRVQKMITGKVSRLGSDYVLAFGIIDLRTQSVGKRVARNAVDLRGLLSVVASALDELLGIAEAKPAFRLARGERLVLAVMPLAAHGVPASTADSLTQIVTYELNQIEGISVMSRDDIRAMLDKFATEGELGCTENLECIVEIGAALGLAKLVTGTVGKLKDTYVIAMQLVDTRKAEVENRVLETFDGAPDELKHAAKLSAYRLAGVDYSERKGRVHFTFDVDEADVRLGDRALKLAHSQLGLSDLAPGRYSLRVVANTSDYYPLQTDVYVAPRGDNVRTFHLAEKSSPWYSKWWVWTISGAVLAVAATTVAVVTTRSSGVGSGEVSFSKQ
jgi:TolB-like protein